MTLAPGAKLGPYDILYSLPGPNLNCDSDSGIGAGFRAATVRERENTFIFTRSLTVAALNDAS
jgi:hypothetical protein